MKTVIIEQRWDTEAVAKLLAAAFKSVMVRRDATAPTETHAVDIETETNNIAVRGERAAGISDPESTLVDQVRVDTLFPPSPSEIASAEEVARHLEDQGFAVVRAFVQWDARA